MERFLKKQILDDLDEKMVFLAGPRQVGKTTLAKSLFKRRQYLNWDVDEDRRLILKKEFTKSDLWVFDEIHKFKTWRNYLKGIYDKLGKDQKILVTGSARLDILRKGGDSLQGRYHFLRLMPLTFKELKMSNLKDAQTLFHLSGFPEPFFSGSQSKCNRWSRSYQERIVRQEVASNELIQDLGNMEILLGRLPDMVGGSLSINNLQEDMQISHKTLSKWIDAFERLYTVFRLPPFGPPKIKAIKKERKLFFYDWNAISDLGSRFENFVALHLLKWIYFQQDVEGRRMELRYYRDKAGREVDFVVIENNLPILLVEAKLADAEISRGLIFLKQKYPKARALQVHLNGKKEYLSEHQVEVASVVKLLSELI
jgi:predicted AAA+ superfamily ATPase